MTSKRLTVWTPARYLKHGQDGLTLVELLVATAMMVILTGAAVTILVSSMRAAPSHTKRADLIGEARAAITSATADIRQATKAVPSGRTGVTLTTFCDKGAGVTESCQVVYACAQEAGTSPASYRCTRKVGTGTAVAFASKLASSSVFCYLASTASPACGETDGSSPSYVGLTLEYRNPGEKSVTTLEDGAALHNLSTYRSQ